MLHVAAYLQGCQCVWRICGGELGGEPGVFAVRGWFITKYADLVGAGSAMHAWLTVTGVSCKLV
jgi:hypothetical protein